MREAVAKKHERLCIELGKLPWDVQKKVIQSFIHQTNLIVEQRKSPLISE